MTHHTSGHCIFAAWVAWAKLYLVNSKELCWILHRIDLWVLHRSSWPLLDILLIALTESGADRAERSQDIETNDAHNYCIDSDGRQICLCKHNVSQHMTECNTDHIKVRLR